MLLNFRRMANGKEFVCVAITKPCVMSGLIAVAGASDPWKTERIQRLDTHVLHYMHCDWRNVRDLCECETIPKYGIHVRGERTPSKT